jgi:hypothetical protein
MSRHYYIAGNWKMHMTREEAANLAQSLVNELKNGTHKYLIAPSFTLIETVSINVKEGAIRYLCVPSFNALTSDCARLAASSLVMCIFQLPAI